MFGKQQTYQERNRNRDLSFRGLLLLKTFCSLLELSNCTIIVFSILEIRVVAAKLLISNSQFLNLVIGLELSVLTDCFVLSGIPQDSGKSHVYHHCE